MAKKKHRNRKGSTRHENKVEKQPLEGTCRHLLEAVKPSNLNNVIPHADLSCCQDCQNLPEDSKKTKIKEAVGTKLDSETVSQESNKTTTEVTESNEYQEGQNVSQDNTNDTTTGIPETDQSPVDESNDDKQCVIPGDVPLEQAICVCLRCGHVACSRQSPHKHALEHYKANNSHPLVVNLSNWIIWCYKCDEDVGHEVNSNTNSCLVLLRKALGPKRKKHGKLAEQDNKVSSNVSSTHEATTIKGLANLGNTCFFNSVMQNLCQIRLLRSAMDHLLLGAFEYSLQPSKIDKEMEPLTVLIGVKPGPLTFALARFLQEMGSDSKKRVIHPGNLFTEICKKAPRFKGFRQQDSQELLRYLLDSVRTEEIKDVKQGILQSFCLKSGVKREDIAEKADGDEREKIRVYGRCAEAPVIDTLFGGQLVSSVECLACHKISTIMENFFDLSLSLANNNPGFNGDFYPSKKKIQKNFADKNNKTETEDVSTVKHTLSKHQQKKKANAAKKAAMHPGSENNEPPGVEPEVSRELKGGEGTRDCFFSARETPKYADECPKESVSAAEIDDGSEAVIGTGNTGETEDEQELREQTAEGEGTSNSNEMSTLENGKNDDFYPSKIKIQKNFADKNNKTEIENASTVKHTLSKHQQKKKAKAAKKERKKGNRKHSGSKTGRTPSRDDEKQEAESSDCNITEPAEVSEDVFTNNVGTTTVEENGISTSDIEKDSCEEKNELPGVEQEVSRELKGGEGTSDCFFSERETSECADECLKESVSVAELDDGSETVIGTGNMRETEDEQELREQTDEGEGTSNSNEMSALENDNVVKMNGCLEEEETGPIANTDIDKFCSDLNDDNIETHNPQVKCENVTDEKVAQLDGQNSVSLVDSKEELRGNKVVDGEAISKNSEISCSSEITRSGECENQGNKERTRDSEITKASRHSPVATEISHEDETLDPESGVAQSNNCGASVFQRNGVDSEISNGHNDGIVYPSNELNPSTTKDMGNDSVNSPSVLDPVTDDNRNRVVDPSENVNPSIEHGISDGFLDTCEEVVPRNENNSSCEFNAGSASTTCKQLDSEKSLPQNPLSCNAEAVTQSAGSDEIGNEGDSLIDVCSNELKNNEGRDSKSCNGTADGGNYEADTTERCSELSEILSGSHSLGPIPSINSNIMSVESCLGRFCNPEILDGNNKFICEECNRAETSDESDEKTDGEKDVLEKCNGENEGPSSGNKMKGKRQLIYTEAVKQLLIYQPPPILTLHLKRFHQVGFALKKLPKHVDFQLTLDLAPFCHKSSKVATDSQGKVLYSLCGVVEHSGSLHSGHYTAYCRLSKPSSNFFRTKFENLTQFLEVVHRTWAQGDRYSGCFKHEELSKGRWFHISDSHVSEVSEERVLKAQAYLLFYERMVLIESN